MTHHTAHHPVTIAITLLIVAAVLVFLAVQAKRAEERKNSRDGAANPSTGDTETEG